MTQASDLGQIANQAGSLYRTRVNTGFQAVATFHAGAAEPDPIYPNMLWFDSGTGQVWLRDPANTAWAVVTTIGPPFLWTAVDVPAVNFTTGDVKQTFKSVADSGWVMMNDGTIGDGSSGGSARANPDTEALFTLLWNNISDTYCTVFVGGTTTPAGRGASAADFASHRKIGIPKALGRALCVAGWGSGLTSRVLGLTFGEENHTLTSSEIPSHGHSFSWSVPAHTHSGGVTSYNGDQGTGGSGAARNQGNTGSGGGYSGSGTTGSVGGGAGHNVMQPSVFCNVMIKL